MGLTLSASAIGKSTPRSGGSPDPSEQEIGDIGVARNAPSLLTRIYRKGFTITIAKSAGSLEPPCLADEIIWEQYVLEKCH